MITQSERGVRKVTHFQWQLVLSITNHYQYQHPLLIGHPLYEGHVISWPIRVLFLVRFKKLIGLIWSMKTEDWILRPRATWEWGGGEFPKPWSARIPPTSSRRGHLLSDTPLFITLWGEISLLRSHVSCKTIQPSEPILYVIREFENHFCSLLCQEKFSQCHLPSAEYYLVMPVLKLHVFIIDARYFSSTERAGGMWSDIDKCFLEFSPVFLPPPVFSPPTKHFQTPGASIEEWRQLFQYLMCLICFVSIACNHT